MKDDYMWTKTANNFDNSHLKYKGTLYVDMAWDQCMPILVYSILAIVFNFQA